MISDINILVVDDVEQNLIAMEAILARPGIRVLKAASGPEALEILLAHEIALALVDVQMPEMNGFEFAELVRGSERTRAVPLIFLTAAGYEAKAAFRGYEAGAVDFLYKPVDVAALQSKVNVFVELHAKEKQLSQQLEELRQALHMNELFTAVLGHDLRNPLASILTGAELMLAITDDPKLRSVAERIQSSGNRMRQMVDQLLDVARIRAGGIQLSLQKTDYEALCRSIVSELGCGGHSSRISIATAGNVTGMADPDRLAQILSNLIGNALHHGDGSQPVRIDIDGTGAGSIVVQTCNGGVIAPCVMERIFKPFQASQVGKKPNQGLGLGLYIVKHFVDAHGGCIELASDQKSGTVFRITMPRG